LEPIIDAAAQQQAATLADLTRPTAAYRRSANLAAAGLLAFVLLYFGLTAWLLKSAWQSIAASAHTQGGFANIVVAAVGILLAIFMIKAIFAVRHAMPSGLVEVKREQQPRLFDYLHALADAAGAPRPYRVFLSNRVNASVFYDLSLLNLFFPAKKNLEIGLPLVNAMPLGELRAVLAHEFGHFAQRSMAVGRWVYVAHQVVQEMVGRRDALDEFIEGFGRLDFRLRVVAWGLQIIVWSLRSLVEQAFRLVILMQRALSREMEMQADLVAVSLTGSDALVHALHRLGSADDAWDRAVGFVFDERNEGRSTSDAYAVQSHVTQRMAGILDDKYYGKVPPLPAQQPQAHRVFKAELGQPPKMWQTHPQNHEREENAKRRYLPAAIDQNSAWTLFDDAAGLRQSMTAQLLEGQDGEAPLVPIEDSLKRLAKVYRREHYQSRYCGVYFGRSLTRFADKAAQLRAARDAAPVVDASLLYPESLKGDVRQLRQLREESAQLAALIAGHTKSQGGRVQVGGEEYRVKQLPMARRQVEDRIGQVEEKLRRHDAMCRAWHYRAAQALGQGWPAYLDSLLEVLHFAEHTMAELWDAFGLMQNTRAVVLAVSRQSEKNINRLIGDCAALQTVLDQIYRGNGQVLLDEQLAERLELKESWQVSLQQFTLPPVSRDNINDWLRGAHNWTHHTANWLGALRGAVLEQLLVCETLVASHQRSGTDIVPAPAPCQVPRGYPVLLPGGERQLQTELDWWSRFQRADGWLAGGARLLVAGVIVAAVLSAGMQLSNSTVLVYNGLGVPVRVFVDGNSRMVMPDSYAEIVGKGSDSHAIAARLADGRLLESFMADDGNGQSIYNVAGAAPLVEWTAYYGGHGGTSPPTMFGAQRWMISNADVFFTEPPHSVSSKSSSTRTVLEGGGKQSPADQVSAVSDPVQRKAMIAAHARWDDTRKAATYEWLGLALENGEHAILQERLQRKPDDVMLRRLEQDSASDGGAAVCAAAQTRAAAAPDNSNLHYLALRCQDKDPQYEAMLRQAIAKWPSNYWLQFALSGHLLKSGQLNEAEQLMSKVVGKVPYPANRQHMLLARLQRQLHGSSEQRLENEAPELKVMMDAELGRANTFAGKLGYAYLDQGALQAALNDAEADASTSARMLRLVAASDGATDNQIRRSLSRQPDKDMSVEAALVTAALAMRMGADAEPFLKVVEAGFGPAMPQVRQFLQWTQKGRYTEAEAVLSGLPLEIRGNATSAGCVLAGSAAPAAWRSTARRLLFAPERPYFRR
jgi:Zn-dependent protease with chaperone function